MEIVFGITFKNVSSIGILTFVSFFSGKSTRGGERSDDTNYLLINCLFERASLEKDKLTLAMRYN